MLITSLIKIVRKDKVPNKGFGRLRKRVAKDKESTKPLNAKHTIFVDQMSSDVHLFI